ncbi:MAG: DNA-binding response regulator [Verrucomicrobia bacterium]|nr:DNA-binding response regulator [Verrucomicrobiota bacterium]NBU10397.1 DNA-binding response regulator [Pseudomonadota bacterium]NDA68168.1 DNA-binding response regulator [Verrucomicrobiota bacterium]NDB77717.1 DNA-binding response regulator [Verrucomicrobiota bacterium]NDD39870.1 DNA-binding response regulator [Verrucomicrobiota bacterium]
MKTKAGKKPAVPRKQILIVDDHPMMREGLAALIQAQSDLAVCGQAADAREAFRAVESLSPDLVLMDISLPGKSGLEAIKDILALRPGLTILVISMHDEALYAERVLRAGARGYIMKQEGGKRILEAIRTVLENKVFVSEKMSARILQAFTGRRTEAAASEVESLTDREFEVFQLIGRGRSTKEIGDQLHISVKTVEVHRVNIKTKLKVATSSELVHYAVRWVESQAGA